MPLIISRCCMIAIMPAVLVEAGMIVNRAEERKCSRLHRAEQLSPERSLRQWSDFAPGALESCPGPQHQPPASASAVEG